VLAAVATAQLSAAFMLHLLFETILVGFT